MEFQNSLFTDPFSDPLVKRLKTDLDAANEIIDGNKVKIEKLENENKEIKEKYEKLLKDSMILAEKYMSIIAKMKYIDL